MKKITTPKRLFVSLSLVLCAFLVLFANFGLRSKAEARQRTLSGSVNQSEVSDLLPKNSVNMRFVSGPSLESPLRELGKSALRPLSLATADLNHDGFPDLVCGYGTSDGGLLVIYYGDERAFAPSQPADIQATLENRYLSPFNKIATIQLDHAPDFLFTGDFDRDSRVDILAAARNGQSLDILRGGDDGGFASKQLELPGQVTAVAVSEVYSADGFADVYVGLAGGQLVTFESMDSVFEQQPTTYSLPGSADSIVPGRFDDGTAADFAVTVSGQVYIVHGGKGSWTEHISVPGFARSVAAGDFIWDRNSTMELAVATDSGTTVILSRGELDTRRYTDAELRGRRQLVTDIRDGKRAASAVARTTGSLRAWQIAEQTDINAAVANGGSPSLIPILASGQQSVDLLAIDPASQSLKISYRTDGLLVPEESVSREEVSLASGDAVAALPMRLNLHGHPSIVVLDRNRIEPELIFFAPEATITVTSAADVLDAAGGNCGSITIANLPGPNGVISLREAVCAANNTAGADTVAFAAALNGVAIQLTRVGDDNTNVNGDLDFNSDISLVGNGAANTLLQGSSSATFTGNMGDKLIGINQAGTLATQNCAISGVTIRFTRNDIAVNGAFTQTGGATDIFLTGTGAAPGPTTTITNTTYDSNANAHSYGGALNIDSGDLAAGTNIFRGTIQITGSTFSNNDTLAVAGADNPPTGGGINLFADRHNVTISSSTINANQTSAINTANGGGINIRHSFGGTITIDSVTNITNNIAGSDGGGVLTAFNQTVNMTGGSISGNTSQGTGDSAAGGGFFNGSNTASPTTLTSVAITNNVATAGTNGTGGGVADSANSALNLTTCTITGNSADNGGGVAVVAAGVAQTTTISNSTAFSGNTATTNGSALLVAAGIATLTNTNTISGNIHVGSDASATLNTATGSTTNLTGNVTMDGGAINGNNAAINITGNYSQSGGTMNSGSSTVGITGTFGESGGTFNGNTSTYNIGSGSTLSNGIFNAGGNFNVTGTHTQSGGTFNGGGTMTITGAGNFTKTLGTFTGGSMTINLLGNLSHTGGTFTAGSSTFNFNGGGAESISNNALITFNNISDVNATQPLVINNSINVSGTITANGAATVISPVAGAVIGGTGTLSGTGTARVTRATGTDDFFGQYTITNKTLTNLLIDYVGAALQGISGTTYSNVRLNNAAGGTLSAPATVNGTLTLAAGAFNVGTSTLTLNNIITSTGGTLTSAATGTVLYNQGTNGQAVLAGQYGNLTFSNFNKTLPPSGTVFVAGTFNPGTATGHTITGSTIEFNGAGAQTIPAFNYNNLASSGAGARTLANAGTIGIAGSFTPGANTYTITGSTINFNGAGGQTIPAFGYNNLTSSGAGARTLSNTGNVRIAGVFTPGTNVYTITGSTVEYNGTVAQSLPSTFIAYNNLTLNNPAGVTGFAGLTVNGLIRVQQGTFTSSSFYNGVQIDSGATLAGVAATTINVTGNWTNNGTFTANGNTVNFNGVIGQTIGGASTTTFNNLTINNALGITLGAPVVTNGLLTLTNGTITTGANLFTIGASGTVSRTSGHIIGTLRKNFSAPGPTFEMPVGTLGAYSPLNVTVTTGSGQLTASANTGVPAVLAPNTARTLQRFWTLSGAGIQSNITFNYLDGDVPGPPNNENIWNIIRVTGTNAVRYPPTLPYVLMEPALNRFTINGLSTYSDWTAGEPLAPTAAGATVSGVVRDSEGRGINGARVMIQGQSGTVYQALTNPFGYYAIEGVPSGQTYLASVGHKRYQFTPRTINLSEDLTGLDFTADGGATSP